LKEENYENSRQKIDTVPDGILKSGLAYRWRVRVADGDNWVKVQNRSHSEWHSFTMAKALE